MPRKKSPVAAVCRIEGCGKLHHARGMCIFHYKKEWSEKKGHGYQARVSKEWREKNLEHARKRARESIRARRAAGLVDPVAARASKKKSLLKCAYGMTVEQFDALLLSQQGRCAICSEVPESSLHVDHCHVTGKIRGLLCTQCNVGIGMMKESPLRLRSAIRYLESQCLEK
jgi:hypothetical protein